MTNKLTVQLAIAIMTAATCFAPNARAHSKPKPVTATPSSDAIDIRQMAATWANAVKPEKAQDVCGRWRPIAVPRATNEREQYFFNYYPTGLNSANGEAAYIDLMVNTTSAPFITHQLDSDLLVQSNLLGPVEMKMVEMSQDGFLAMKLGLTTVYRTSGHHPDVLLPFWELHREVEYTQKVEPMLATLHCAFTTVAHKQLICLVTHSGWQVPKDSYETYMVFELVN
jgi:hypothetical protein